MEERLRAQRRSWREKPTPLRRPPALAALACTSFACAFILSACTERTTPVPEDATTRRDSSGIEIVENPEDAPDTSGWRLDPTPRVTIGDESRGHAYSFTHISAVARLTDGRLVVADGLPGAATELRLYDSTGAYLRNIGRPGRGPGEYRSVLALYLLPRDTLVVASGGEGPLFYFDNTGSYVRTVPRTSYPPDPDIGRYRTIGLRGVFPDGTLLSTMGWQSAWVTTRDIPPRRPHAYVDTAKLIRGVPDSVIAFFGVIPSRRGVLYARARGDTPFFDPHVFGQPSVAIRGMQVLVSEGEKFEIREYAPDGALVRIIRKRHAPVPLPDAWIDSMHRERMSPSERYPDLRWLLDVPPPRPAVAPAIDQLLIDDDGNLWVHSNQRRRSAGEPIWYVFDSTGALRHSLRLDADDVRVIARDRIVAVGADSLGVPRVVVHALLKD